MATNGYPEAIPTKPPEYDFVQLGEGLAQNLLQAAEDQVAKAQMMLDQTQALAKILRDQVHAQAQQLEEMNQRFRAFGQQMLEAHRTLNGDVTSPTTDL